MGKTMFGLIGVFSEFELEVRKDRVQRGIEFYTPRTPSLDTDVRETGQSITCGRSAVPTTFQPLACPDFHCATA
jgi:hypothetical protein